MDQQQQCVLVAGGINVDIIAHASGSLLSGDSVPGRIIESPGGVGRNIAVNLARLGIRTSLLGVVGADFRGDWVLDDAIASGVNVDHVHRVSSLATSTYVVIADQSGHTGPAVSDMRIMDEIAADWLQSEMNEIGPCSALVFDCNLACDVIQRLMLWACDHQVPVFAEGVSATKVIRLHRSLSNIHTLKINSTEALSLLSQLQLTAESPVQAAEELLKAGVHRVVISQGESGVILADNQGVRSVSSEPCQVRADTGAGDALMSGLVAAFILGVPDARQIKFALVCAALTLESDQACDPDLSIDKVHRRIGVMG